MLKKTFLLTNSFCKALMEIHLHVSQVTIENTSARITFYVSYKKIFCHLILLTANFRLVSNLQYYHVWSMSPVNHHDILSGQSSTLFCGSSVSKDPERWRHYFSLYLGSLFLLLLKDSSLYPVRLLSAFSSVLSWGALLLFLGALWRSDSSQPGLSVNNPGWASWWEMQGPWQGRHWW